MDIIVKDSTNKIYCNISNEVVFDFFTMVIQSPEYSVNVTLSPPNDVDDRYVVFDLVEGTEDLANATIELPNNGDYPYKIINAEIEGGVDGTQIHRGILRLKQPQDIVYSYTDEDSTIIYE